MTRTTLIFLIAASVLVDQLTKAAALSLLSQRAAVPVVPGFNMAGKPLLMAALTGALALIFAVMAFRARHPLERAGLALVVGGALGNIIDRLRQGAVTDFLDLYWRDWHWPTFNGADIAITLGALCILAASLPSHRRKEPVLDRN